jgi:hypothetical protein
MSRDVLFTYFIDFQVKNGAAAAAAAEPSAAAFNLMDPNMVLVEQPAAMTNAPLTYESLGIVDKKSLLQQMCGVVSEHTGKLCTRSLRSVFKASYGEHSFDQVSFLYRCPQHSDEQKRNIRLALLGPTYEQNQLLGTYISKPHKKPSNNENFVLFYLIIFKDCAVNIVAPAAFWVISGWRPLSSIALFFM